MVFRQTRLTARLLYATILSVEAASLLYFGPDHLLQSRHDGAPALTVLQSAIRTALTGLLMMLAHEQAARVKRWRRNIMRAGGVFATSWLGGLALALAIQVMRLAGALGYSVDQGAGYATVIGVILLFRRTSSQNPDPPGSTGSHFRSSRVALMSGLGSIAAPPGGCSPWGCWHLRWRLSPRPALIPCGQS
jgi:hypothetical protein